MDNRKKIVIIGATSSIARHCAKLWVQKKPVEMILIGRNGDKLKRVQRDLQVYGENCTIKILQSEMLRPEDIKKIIAACCQERLPDIVLIAHGILPEQKRCQSDLQYNCNSLCVNALSPALFAEGFVSAMRYGTVAVIGSVAGDRGRRSDYVYGAAKGLLARYIEGLQHRIAAEKDCDINILLIKPGPTATPMTAEIEADGFAPVSLVARDIVAAIEKRKSLLYTPGKWWVIMQAIGHLPQPVFNRIDM